MPSISNVGGSISTAVALTLLAWAIRTVRAANQRREGDRDSQDQPAQKQSRFLCRLSAAAVRLLVETVPFPHAVVDLRPAGEGELPRGLRQATRVTGKDLLQAAASGQALPGGITTSWLLVVVTSDGAPAPANVLQAAAKAGVSWVAVLEGGLQAYLKAAAHQAGVRYISRDALGVLLGLSPASPPPDVQPIVLDVRRPDERSLFGAIPGSVSVPAVQLAAALQQPAEEWQRQYRCAPPQAEDLVVMYSRAHTRAAWAAQVAADQGLRNCFVLLQGISAWHLHPGAHAYRAYGEDDPPPEPEPSQVHPVDPHEARRHLIQCGLL